MTNELSSFNIDVSATHGVPIDTTVPPRLAVYKLVKHFLATFPNKLTVQLSSTDNDAQWQILNMLAEVAKKYEPYFFDCHNTLPKECYRGFNLVSDDKKTIHFFIDRNAYNAILVKGISNSIVSLKTAHGENVPYKRANAIHNSAGVLWIFTNKIDFQSDFIALTLKLKSPLKLYLGSGAPITQN